MAQFTASQNYTNLLNQQLPFYGNVAFPASQVTSADANTLDDYEEGTWTPSVGGSATYSLQAARYTKVGRLVAWSMQMVLTAIGTGSTGTVSGFPFTAGAISAFGVGFFVGAATSYTFVNGYIASASASLTFNAIAAAGANMTSPAVFFGSTTNVVASGHMTV